MCERYYSDAAYHNVDLCWLEYVEYFSVKQFAAKLGVPALAIAILPWAIQSDAG